MHESCEHFSFAFDRWHSWLFLNPNVLVRFFRFMNITLNEVVFIDQRKQMHAYDDFMVPARNIKYIHIPKEVIGQKCVYIGFICFECDLNEAKLPGMARIRMEN